MCVVDVGGRVLAASCVRACEDGMKVATHSQRVEKQKQSPIFVIIGNPPYNANQVNENDNNKNRKYKALDKRVSETYAKDSNATLLNKLSDPYVKAIRWAVDRLGDAGIIAFVTNNSFVDNLAFDGILSVGMMLLMISGVFDLSVGAMASMTSPAFSSTLAQPENAPPAICLMPIFSTPWLGEVHSE